MKHYISLFRVSALLSSLLLLGNYVIAQSSTPLTAVPLPSDAAAAQSRPPGATDPAEGVPAVPSASQSPSAQATAASAAAQNSAAIMASGHDLKIGDGDLLEVAVFGVGDFNQTVRVSESGDVILPLIGQVHVSNLTPPKAQDLIAEKLVQGNFYRHPQVTLFIKEYATQGVSVLGEVNKPGVYPRLGERRLFDMISAAGGYTPRAGTTVTVTHRGQPDKPQTVTLSNDPVKSQASNVEVLPGDTIVVSQAGIVYVVGDVSKPSGFAMQNNENMSVLQALAMAGGANPTAKLDNARLIRKNSSGMQEMPMPLKKILQAKATDQTLQAGDILFVPASTGKNAAKRGLEAILQTATGVAIYHPW
jgi:polysaccharide export outer membrane protein